MAGYIVVDDNRSIISLAIELRIILFGQGWYELSWITEISDDDRTTHFIR